MSTLFPGAKDDNTTLPNPTADSPSNSPDHASEHANANDAIKALQDKLGISAASPADAPLANRLFFAPANGKSSWAQITSAQLAASMTDASGTGLAVFNDTPTLLTPKIGTIQEATVGAGVTIDGLTLKDGALVNANAVGTANISDGAITGPKLGSQAVGANNIGTSAIYLGSNTLTTSKTTTSTSQVEITELATTVTIPSGGRKIRITLFVSAFYNTGSTGGNISLQLWDGAVTTGSKIQAFTSSLTNATGTGAHMMWLGTPPAGSRTYRIGFSASVSTATASVTASTDAPTILLVEAL